MVGKAVICFLILLALFCTSMGPYLLVTQDASDPQSYHSTGLMFTLIAPVLLAFLYGFFSSENNAKGNPLTQGRRHHDS